MGPAGLVGNKSASPAGFAVSRCQNLNLEEGGAWWLCPHLAHKAGGLSVKSQSGRQDSNLRPSAFQALPGLFGRCNPVEYEEKQLVTRPSHGNQKRDIETNCLKVGIPSGAEVWQD